MLEQYNDIRFKIVAPKEKCGAFENMQNVTIVSGLNDDELVACYRQASCLLMTVECATANNAIVEALACGVPIVSENIGGIAEYTGTDSALLCEPGSVEGLTTAILTLYEQREQAEKMGRFARQRGKELEWPLVATRTIRVYEQILSDFARSRRGLPHSP